jgi:hypothetical protein
VSSHSHACAGVLIRCAAFPGLFGVLSAVLVSQEDWEDLLDMMKEDAAEINGELEVEIVAVPAAAAPPAQDYSLTLFMGDDEVGHVAVSPSDSWAQFLDKVNSAHVSHGSKVEWIKYDDTYGPEQENDIQCRSQTDWEVPPQPLNPDP